MDSELATLIELALKEGASYRTLLAEIQRAVELAFRKKYKEAGEISVVLDQQTDTVKILSNDKDITPKTFKEQASRIARRIILDYINEKGSPAPTPPPPPPLPEARILTMKIEKSQRSWTKPIANILFWGYNGLYLLYVLVFLLSLLSSSVRSNLSLLFQNGNAFSALCLLLLLSYPIVIVYYVLKTKLFRTARDLMRLFFIVEIPMVTLTFFTLFAAPAPIPAVGIGILLALFMPLALYLTFIKRTLRQKSENLFLIVNTLGAAVTGYISILLSFWIPPLIGGVVEIVKDILFPRYYSGREVMYAFDIFEILIKLTFTGILILLGAVVVLLPFFACCWFAKNVAKFNRATFTALGFLLVLFLFSSYQPSTDRLLADLSAFSKATTFIQKESLAKNLVERKFELENALDKNINLHKYPFNKEDRSLEKAYQSTLGVPDSVAVVMQELFDVAAAPLVYRGQTDYSGKLTQAYYDLFGEYPNQIRSKCGLGSKCALVEPQNVDVIRTITSKPDKSNLTAEITIEEQYQNKTYQNQEVIYEFSLPEEAVVTDLKLGSNLEFTAVVAPRGAAETVYQEEVNRSRDPALLEQTGPSQYRLRVFPIPGLNDTTLGGKPQRMQFSYVASRRNQGYPLPVYSKTNNVKLISGNYAKAQYIPASANVNLCNETDSVTIDLSSSTISAQLIPHVKNERLSNLVCGINGVSALSKLANSKIAVLFDVSYENRFNRKLAEFQKLIKINSNLVSNNAIDFYRFNTTLSPARKVKSTAGISAVYFGRSDLLKVLPKLKGSYDAVMVVTGQKEFAQSGVQSLTPAGAPVYLVHTNSPPAYPQKLTEYVLSSGGTATTSIEEAFNRLALAKMLGSTAQVISPYWSIEVSPAELPLAKITTSDPLSSFAAYGLFVTTLTQEKNRLSDLLLLDKLHQFASLSRFATPYSSFIALVNEAQMKQLEEESKRYSRYLEKSTLMFVPQPMVEMRGDVVFEQMAPPTGALFSPPQMLKSAPMMGIGGGSELAMPAFNGAGGGVAANIGSFALVWPFIGINVLLVALGAGTILVIYLRRKIHLPKTS